MASVYYLFDDALHVADDIVEKYSQQDQNLKENHYAATIVQRSYRSYVARKKYKKVIRAVIVLQKYVRGWLVKYHLVDAFQEYWDRICLQRYNAAATKLQAAWRGVLVRDEINIAEIMDGKRRTAETARDFGNGSLEIEFSTEKRQTLNMVPRDDEDIPFGGAPLGHDLFLKMEILDMLFDRHHLLSTKVHGGVLTANRELKAIEKVLKTLPWKNYITKMRKMYYKNRKAINNQKPAYTFEDKNMRRQEDLLKLRDKTQDVREEFMGNCIADNREPFKLYSKIERLSYEPSVMSDGKFVKTESNITRTEDKSKNVSDKDFIVTLKEIVKECKIPPYYADFWYRDCTGHNFPE